MKKAQDNKYPILILNVILFSILFTYILFDGLSIFSLCFLKYPQSNPEYLNMTHLVIQIFHSMLELMLNLVFLYKPFMFFHVQ